MSSRISLSSWEDSRQAGRALYTVPTQQQLSLSSSGTLLPPMRLLPGSDNKTTLLLILILCDAGPLRRDVTMMGNKATGGPFAPLVVLVKRALGDKEFNKLRGKGISLHSQGTHPPPPFVIMAV